MNNTHAERKKAAQEAIDNLHSDTSVGRETTIDSLEEIQEHMAMLIQTLKRELRDEETAAENGDFGPGEE